MSTEIVKVSLSSFMENYELKQSVNIETQLGLSEYKKAGAGYWVIVTITKKKKKLFARSFDSVMFLSRDLKTLFFEREDRITSYNIDRLKEWGVPFSYEVMDD